VVVEKGLELGTGVALVGKDRLPRAGGEELLLDLEEIADVALSNIHVPTMLVGVDGAAHMIAGDRNDAFSDAVIAFLRDRVRPTID
jgi:hypothetical protein